MIEITVTGINSDADVAKVTEELNNIGSLNEIMVTLEADSRASVVVTGEASDDELRDAVTTAGDYSVADIDRQKIDPYNQDR